MAPWMRSTNDRGAPEASGACRAPHVVGASAQLHLDFLLADAGQVI